MTQLQLETTVFPNGVLTILLSIFFIPCSGLGQTGTMDWDSIPVMSLPTAENTIAIPETSPSYPSAPPEYMDSLPPNRGAPPVQPVPSVSPPTHSVPVASPPAMLPSTSPPSTVRPPSPITELRSVEDTNHPLYGLLRPPVTDTEIRGVPAPLATVIAGVSSPEERGKLIRLYWEMTGLLIEYHCIAQQEQSLAAWLKGAQPATGTAATGQTAILQAGLQVATAQRRMTELEFLQKQCQLAAAMRRHSLGSSGGSIGMDGVTPTSYGMSMSTFVDDTESTRTNGTNGTATSPPLPLPCDYPLVLPYDPKISAISKISGRPLSLKAVTLSKTIPLQYRLVMVSAEAFRAADTLFATIRDGGNLTPESLLLAFDQQVTAKITYVRSIIEYNQQIADYVAETVGPEIHGRALLSTMLVLTPVPMTVPTASENQIIPAGNRSSMAGSGHIVTTGGMSPYLAPDSENSEQGRPVRNAQPFGYTDRTDIDVADTIPMIPPVVRE